MLRFLDRPAGSLLAFDAPPARVGLAVPWRGATMAVQAGAVSLADVFVSYHRSDRARAEEAVASLVDHGFTVWWDDRVTPMETWDRTVEREIDDARCVLVLWTAESAASDWVRIEANFAKMAKPAKLVQVRLEDCRVPINFSMIQYTDAFGETLDPAANEGWARALEWVGLFVGPRSGRGAPTPAPAQAKPKRKRKRAAAPQPLYAAAEAPAIAPSPALPPRSERAAVEAEAPSPSAPPRPPINIEAALGRIYASTASAFGSALSVINRGGYYQRGLAIAAVSVFIGALIYFWCHEMWVNSGGYDSAWVILAPFLLRACGGAGLAYVFVSTGRLVRRPALIFLAGFVAIHLIYRVLSLLTGGALSGAALSLLGDALGFALLFLLARQLGAFTVARSWPLLMVVLGACLLLAFLYAGAQLTDRVPPDYDSGSWATFMGASLLLECALALILIEPLRAGAPMGDKTE